MVSAVYVPLGKVTMQSTTPHSATDAADEVCDRLGEDGYAVVEGMFDPAALARARPEIGAILDATPLGRDDFEGRNTRRIYALFAKTRAFDDAATHPLILAVLDRILRHYQLSAPAGIEIGPGEAAQPLHPDDAIYPVPRPHAELVVNVMWPLDDFTVDNGATRIVRGSHRWTDRQPGPDDAVTQVEMPAGSALLYVGSLWHGGGANHTDSPRVGVVLHYAASWLRPVENHVLAVPRDVVAQLPERLQELLGYNIGPPFIGYVDGRHPKHTLRP
jgi:ectoine hydroxylase-related dioxygenase (phytanoyl-CoA dioxygenase family)